MTGWLQSSAHGRVDVMCCLEESALIVVASPCPGRAVIGEMASVF